eukprot:jgi/Picre1/30279/NNA_005643.t1
MTERLLRLLTILKYGLVENKVLIFVNSPDTGMRTRLFLDAFGIRCSEMHSEMPLNTRNHLLQQFNRGLFDYLIATDDVHGMDDASKGKKGKKNKKDEEFGVTRGIDFKGVKTVINLELPSSIDGYTTASVELGGRESMGRPSRSWEREMTPYKGSCGSFGNLWPVLFGV